MKKYFIIALITAIAILISSIAGDISASHITYDGEYAARKTAVSQVRVNGIIENAFGVSQTAEGTGTVKSVAAKTGDHVDEGDIVLCVYETGESVNFNSIDFSEYEDYESIIDSIKESAVIKTYTASKSGIITAMNCTEGDFFIEGQDLFSVSSEDTYQAALNVPEKDISKVSIDQKVIIKCPALSHTISGTVTSIGSTALRNTLQSDKPASVKVIVDIGSSTELRAGYTADCRIITEMRDNVLLIPSSSYKVNENNEPEIFVMNDKNGKPKRRIITIGTVYTNGTEVTDGLKEGEIIVKDYSEAGMGLQANTH